MSKVSSKLRRYDRGYMHWCPACERMHPLPDSWKFVNGDLEKPTFHPSFKHTGVYGKKWVVVPGGWICHYNLVEGVLQFCDDCTHELKNQKVPLPDLGENQDDT